MTTSNADRPDRINRGELHAWVDALTKCTGPTPCAWHAVLWDPKGNQCRYATAMARTRFARPESPAEAMRRLAKSLVHDADPETDTRIFDPWDVKELLDAEADRLDRLGHGYPNGLPDLPLHLDWANSPAGSCGTCHGGGCPDCTDRTDRF